MSPFLGVLVSQLFKNSRGSVCLIGSFYIVDAIYETG